MPTYQRGLAGWCAVRGIRRLSMGSSKCHLPATKLAWALAIMG